MRAFHFCAEYVGADFTHVFAGVVATNADPFDPNFYNDLRGQIAAQMAPQRPPNLVTIKSLSLLAHRN